MTAAQYSLPSSVGCSVISVSHNRFGASTSNCRLTRSAHGSASGSRTVVHDRRRKYKPWIPASRISRATRFSFTGKPIPRVNSAWTRGEPYDFIFGSAWIFSISRSSMSFSCCRADTGRLRHS